MLACGLDPATGKPLPETQPAPQPPETRSFLAPVRDPRNRKSAKPRKQQRPEPAAPGFRFVVIDDPLRARPARDRRSEDHDALAIILSLNQYIVRRRASGSKTVSGADRFRAGAKLALEQQWTLEYWRARAVHFELELQVAEEKLAAAAPDPK